MLLSRAFSLLLAAAAVVLVVVVLVDATAGDARQTVTKSTTTDTDGFEEQPPSTVSTVATVVAPVTPTTDATIAGPNAGGAAAVTFKRTGNTVAGEEIVSTVSPNKLSDAAAAAVIGVAVLLVVLALYRHRIQSVKLAGVEIALRAAAQEIEKSGATGEERAEALREAQLSIVAMTSRSFTVTRQRQ